MGMIQRRNDAIENSRRTNQAGPLRRIVKCADTGWGWGTFEILECGHNGNVRNCEAYVIEAIEAGKRRRCAACGKVD